MNWEQYHLLMDSEAITDPTDFRIMVAMVHFASEKGAEVYASKEKIAKKARLAVLPVPRATIDGLKRLVKQGHLTLLSKGGGKAKTDRYRVNIQSENGADTLHEMQGIGELNTAPDAGYGEQIDSDTLHLTTENNGYTLHPTTQENSIPCIPRHSYKDEVQDKELKSSIEEDVFNARGAQIKTGVNQPQNSQNPNHQPFIEGRDDPREETPHFLAVAEACKLDLKTVSFPTKSKAIVCSVVCMEAGYSPEEIKQAGLNWPFDKAPTPRQLQDEIRALLSHKEKPTEVKNGSNRQHVYETPFQRNFRLRRESMEERGLIPKSETGATAPHGDGRIVEAGSR